jgi:hypothetical protein
MFPLGAYAKRFVVGTLTELVGGEPATEESRQDTEKQEKSGLNIHGCLS